jgi:hypothetical protein
MNTQQLSARQLSLTKACFDAVGIMWGFQFKSAEYFRRDEDSAWVLEVQIEPKENARFPGVLILGEKLSGKPPIEDGQFASIVNELTVNAEDYARHKLVWKSRDHSEAV